MRKAVCYLVVMAVVFSFTGRASALLDPEILIGINPDNTIPGTIAISIYADGGGRSWSAAEMTMDLTSGSVYNDSVFNTDSPQDSFWPIFPELEYDTWFGIPGSGYNAVDAFGASTIGGGPKNIGGSGTGAISIAWGNHSNVNISLVRIANITVTDDATGNWQLLAVFRSSHDFMHVNLQGTIADIIAMGPIPEPASMTVLGVTALAMTRRGNTRIRH